MRVWKRNAPSQSWDALGEQMDKEDLKAAIAREQLMGAGAAIGSAGPPTIKEVLQAFEQFEKGTYERLYRLENTLAKYERIFRGIVDQEISDRLDLGPKTMGYGEVAQESPLSRLRRRL